MNRYDSIVIGAGHNGLVCAAYLSKAGQRVLVVEASEAPGGLVANREFHPGFHASVAHSISHFPRKIANDLNLVSALEGKPLPSVGLGVAQDHVVLHDDTVSGISTHDESRFRDYSRRMHRFAEMLEPFWLKLMPRIGNSGLGEMLTFAHIGINLRRLGKREMREFLRMVTLPVRDLMDEYFENDILKTVLGWDGLVGSKLAPRSPNSSVLAMLYRMAGESRGAHVVPAGGVNGLIEALCKSATASGADLRCGAQVSRVLVDGSADGLVATGVRLDDGETIEADRIIAATDPKRTFLNMVGVEYLDIGFTNRIGRLRCDGYVAKLHLALDGMPEFAGLQQPDGRMIIAPDLDAIEFAYDDAKYGECSRDPVLEIVVPSCHESSLAPAGKHLLSAHVMYVPYRLQDGWTDQARDRMRERTIDTIARYAPGIREQIIAQEFLTPADIEREYGVTGGHWHHTELALDQMLMMRPTFEAAQYGTPIPGLYLCGAGCHPGGDITGAAGHNAANEILR